jgi:hypothetical protein
LAKTPGALIASGVLLLRSLPGWNFPQFPNPKFEIRNVLLLLIGSWHEAGTMRIVSCFPYDDYLVDRNVATLTISIAKVQHS